MISAVAALAPETGPKSDKPQSLLTEKTRDA